MRHQGSDVKLGDEAATIITSNNVKVDEESHD